MVSRASKITFVLSGIVLIYAGVVVASFVGRKESNLIRYDRTNTIERKIYDVTKFMKGAYKGCKLEYISGDGTKVIINSDEKCPKDGDDINLWRKLRLDQTDTSYKRIK
tara:strand:+ start:19833 stop:20159 length:327 start_codon:yes stop_codon:yes gene_type:complete